MIEVSLRAVAVENRSTTSCGSPARTARSWMLPASEPNSTASDSAAPNVPPMERKNVTELVATPMSRGGMAFCTLMTSVCIDRPRPAPISTMYDIVCGTGVSTVSVDMSIRAANIIAMPPTGNHL